jgi:CDP-2,3-bis-(O-geranylgeranyl)-sn-glycerol synthase
VKDALFSFIQVLYFFLPAYLANMAPVLVRGTFECLALPIDGGRMLGGKRIFGDHKTWRGLIAGVVAGALVFELQRLAYEAGWWRELAFFEYSRASPLPGALMSLGALAGDAIKSFFKRRVGIAPGASWLLFDQLDFFIGAYAFVAFVYAPPLWPTFAAVPVILVCNIAVNAIGYLLGFKETWI